LEKAIVADVYQFTISYAQIVTNGHNK